MASPSDPEPALPSAGDIRLIMTDVDGTFLTDKHEVHPRTRSAIEYLRKHHRDIQISVVTGKQRNSCEWFIKELDFDDSPAGSCHGCIIHGPQGEVLKTLGIGNDNAIAVAEEAIKTNLTCFLFTVDETCLVHAEAGASRDWVTLAAKYDKNVVDTRGTDFLERVKRNEVPVIKATICLDVGLAASKMEHFSALLPSTLRVTRALPFILEVVPKDVDKSVALRHFCDLLKCGPENVLAFGDGANDVEMLAAAGSGVAMANSMPEAKAVAKYTTLSNNEGGVGVFLDRIFRPDRAGDLQSNR